MGRVDAPTAEFLTIVEAIKIFGSSSWASSHQVTVESDCSNVVSWFLQPHNAPYSFMQSIISCRRKWARWKWELELIPREANEVADNLAKRGINRSHDIFCLPPG
ncbi:hypothetical protein V6N12_046194 [Hibiscus sabdariffa]|uniref:RNase H type-1 domain-containing protein n=1 Tax=Hibiscus sabdariffa TaxID=183260 RepID=A0ABR2APK5_9ROSI